MSKLAAKKISPIQADDFDEFDNPRPAYPAKRLPKFRRAPEKLPNRQTTSIDFDIIKLLHDFKFLSSTQLWKLVGADRKAVYKHLQTLYHQELINRFHFPTMFGAGEFYYYLDNTDALNLLVSEIGHQKTEFNYEEVRRNKQKAYGDMRFDGDENSHNEGKLLFLRHETMISRFHVALELACRATNGKVILKTWKQGAELNNYVFAPAYKLTNKSRNGKTVTQLEEDEEEQERIPHRPDAFFTLAFPKKAYTADASFLYEAERQTNSAPTLNKKLRGHWYAIARQKLHKQEPYNVPSIRAVLIEATTYHWANHLYREAHSKVVSPNQSKLFWFTCLEQLTKPEKVYRGTAQSKEYPYLESPLKFFDRFWVALGQEQPFSLLD